MVYIVLDMNTFSKRKNCHVYSLQTVHHGTIHSIDRQWIAINNDPTKILDKALDEILFSWYSQLGGDVTLGEFGRHMK